MRKYWLLLLLGFSLSLLGACGGGGSVNSGGGGGATHFSVGSPANIPSGTSFSVTVTALDASNKNVTNYSGTVHLTSSDPHAQLSADVTYQYLRELTPYTRLGDWFAWTSLGIGLILSAWEIRK